MLDQRRRRWANIEPTLGECLVFAGIYTANAHVNLFQLCVGGDFKAYTK